MSDAKPSLLGREPAVRMYVFLCLAALAVILLVLLERNYGRWSLFPIVVGLLGMVFRWRSGPLLFLIALVGFILVEYLGPQNSAWRLFNRRLAPLSDWVLCGACLAFVMAQYRLQGLTSFIFPPHPRARKRPAHGSSGTGISARAPAGQEYPAHEAPPRRSGALVSPTEAGLFLLSLPLWSALAQYTWAAIAPNAGALGLEPALNQLVLLTWLVAVGLLLVASVLSHIEQRRQTVEEATLFLQDTLWHETRREQRRVQQWFAWKRLRRPHRKENP